MAGQGGNIQNHSRRSLIFRYDDDGDGDDDTAADDADDDGDGDGDIPNHSSTLQLLHQDHRQNQNDPPNQTNGFLLSTSS